MLNLVKGIRMAAANILRAIYRYKYNSMHMFSHDDLLVHIQMHQIVKEIASLAWSSSSLVEQSPYRLAAESLGTMKTNAKEHDSIMPSPSGSEWPE